MFLIEIYESDLIELLNGRRLEIEVGTIPTEARSYLGCSRDTIFLSQHSLKHIFRNHGDHISAKEITLIPTILMRGMWLSDKRPNFVIVSSVLEDIRFKAAIKTTEDRRRNYISTFHRTAKRQTKSLVGRGNVLRPAW